MPKKTALLKYPKLLNSIKHDNVYGVYPHTLFCNTYVKDRCVTHDGIDNFYADDDHPSLKGSELINKLIFKEVERSFSNN